LNESDITETKIIWLDQLIKIKIMILFFWLLVLLSSIGSAHWGAEQLATPLLKLRSQWGLTEAAGATLVAFATASTEIGTNTASVIRGVSDIGLGNLLGCSIISVPALITVAYVAGRKKTNNSEIVDSPKIATLNLEKEALTAQAIPYLAVITLAALLTLPKPWRGLQPIDGWLMLIAYGIYLFNVMSCRQEKKVSVQWQTREISIFILGVVALIIGAYYTVMATEKIVVCLGIPPLLGGLFFTSSLSLAPEAFATWNLAKSGQVTTAATSFIANNIATMTLAFFPLAMVSLSVGDFTLYLVNFTFVALLAAAYAVFLHWRSPKPSFYFRDVVALNSIYLVYLVVVFYGVTKLIV
jgi:cation:H+ antiporter